MAVQTWLVDLPEAECHELLAGAVLGRLGVIVDGRPEIYPVNHSYDRETGSVLVPTKPGTKLHGALDWPWVAYEVDGIDQESAQGWSVLVVGQAEEVTDPGTIDRAVRDRKVSWWPGRGAQWLRIVPSKTTGRRIRAVESAGAGADDPGGEAGGGITRA